MIFDNHITLYENAPPESSEPGIARLLYSGLSVKTDIPNALTALMAFNLMNAAGRKPTASIFQTIRWLNAPTIQSMRAPEPEWLGPECLIPFRKLKKDGVLVGGAVYLTRHMAACLAYLNSDFHNWRFLAEHIPLFTLNLWPLHHVGHIEDTSPGPTLNDYIYGSENYEIAMRRLNGMAENFLTQIIADPRTLKNVLRMRGVELAGAME